MRKIGTSKKPCQLFLLTYRTSRRVARIWKKGGAILKEWELCKGPWPEVSLFLNQFHTVCPKIKTKFLGKLGNSKVFSAQNQVVSKKKKKKKKKGLHRNWDWFFGRIRKSKRFRGGCFPMGGGYFQFFTKNRAQNHQKGAILHNSQANGGGSSPPRLPWLRYCVPLKYSAFRVLINLRTVPFKYGTFIAYHPMKST